MKFRIKEERYTRMEVVSIHSGMTFRVSLLQVAGKQVVWCCKTTTKVSFATMAKAKAYIEKDKKYRKKEQKVSLHYHSVEEDLMAYIVISRKDVKDYVFKWYVNSVMSGVNHAIDRQMDLFNRSNEAAQRNGPRCQVWWNRVRSYLS